MATARTASLARTPAVVWILTSSVSVQIGAAIAVHLFGQVGPTGAVTLRLALSALMMLAVFRPRLRAPERTRADLVAAATFGLVLAAMNLSFYEAIHRIPLGVAVTVEFVGPLAVSVVGSRRLTDALWGLLAGAAVVLLFDGAGAGAVGHRHETLGVAFALLAGCFWAVYILLSREVGRRWPSGAGLAVSLGVAGVVLAPLGFAANGATLLRPSVLALGLGVAVLSSALPYSLEMMVLQRVTPRAFGVLMSLEPAMASVVGLILLGQGLDGRQILALVLVVAANAGSALMGTRRPEGAAIGD